MIFIFASMEEIIVDRISLTKIKRVFVVTGYKSKEINEELVSLNKSKTIEIISLYNPNWEKDNGISVLTAKNHIKSPFVLLMSDHLFLPDMLKQLIETKIENNQTILAIDKQIKNNTLVDLDDVTKVKVDSNNILDIGKNITGYNAFDTGMFLSSSYLFNAIEQSSRQGDSSLSGGMLILRQKQLAKAVEIQNARWIDVDTPEMLKKAAVFVEQGNFF